MSYEEPKPMPSMLIGGITLIASPMMVEYKAEGRPVRYHRKKRIQKKLLKRYGRRFIEVPKPHLIEVKPGYLVGHPETIMRMRAEIEAQTAKEIESSTQADHAPAASEERSAP